MEGGRKKGRRESPPPTLLDEVEPLDLESLAAWRDEDDYTWYCRAPLRPPGRARAGRETWWWGGRTTAFVPRRGDLAGAELGDEQRLLTRVEAYFLKAQADPSTG